MIPVLDVGATYAELKPQIDAAVARVLDGGYYILGPEVEAFERAFADYCGVRRCVGLGNGLEALILSLRALDIGPGDEVIVPSNTYIATWLAISAVGATIVPVEPDPQTHCIDPMLIDAAITPHTRCIMPVHLYGHPADMAAIMRIARARGLRVVEDAAQAQSAATDNRRVGGHGDVVAWSFYPTKNLGAFGDSGAVTTDDDALADRIAMLRNYGSGVKYYNEVKGYNSRLDPLQAAILGVKLEALDDWQERRRRLAGRFQAAFADLPITVPTVPPGAVHAWHLFVIQADDRDALAASLAAAGVASAVHYPVPPYLQRAYVEFADRAGEFPIATRLADTVLSLPMGPHLSDGDADRVIDAVRAHYARAAA